HVFMHKDQWQLVRRLKKGSSFISKLKHFDSDSKTQLFGQPLCKICPDSCSLPKPVKILLLLRRKGPSTEGVFRKPCNNKNMRDIKEQLNSGLEVDIEAQPVVILVGLLKSFLKELPGSLLVSELYDDWMSALDNEDTQQRAVEMRKVLDKLKVANKLLLQHLLCVLYHILERADTNKMDAHNLAVCIAPTLLQLDYMPLNEQKEKIEKVTKLTQFLIEHSELLGENIPNLLDTDEDLLSSQHPDSAYDSTDPDGDGEGGESTNLTHRDGGSSSSLTPPSFGASSWSADASFNTMPEVIRRCSEPIILPSPLLKKLCSQARSHDDCSVIKRDFEGQLLKKQISDDSLLLRGRGGARPVLSFLKLSSSSDMDPLPCTAGSRTKDCSCSSLESTASNQSEGSVFINSPVGSPACPRRANTTSQPSVAVKAQQDITRPISDEKKHSQARKVAGKVLMRTKSLGRSLKKDSRKDHPFPCETLREDSQSEADPPADHLHKPRPLSAIEVFKLVDSRLPCRPPPYEQAVQSTGLPPQYEPLTVHNAIKLERSSRLSSVHYVFPSTCSANKSIDSLAHAAQDKANADEQWQPFRPRAMSESVSAGNRKAVCSQPVFEEFSYTKESYV
uniref:Rho-GAP domain-containing protein n=1 Tax=Mola mola TaxID=94237 RepID=A0A3Q3VVT8_MOLML